METIDAIKARASTRAFLDRPVARATVEAILDAARWAPSGANIQPWKVAAVCGAVKKRLGEALRNARAAGQPGRPDYTYYPPEWTEPYISRRRACGVALYNALDIGRDDKAKRMSAWLANYDFFGAPVGLLFFMDRSLATGSYLDTGMFLQNVMLAAVDAGLATCPQAALAEYPDIVRAELGLPDSLLLVCGMSLGYPDPDAPVNLYRTEREPVGSFLTWHE